MRRFPFHNGSQMSIPAHPHTTAAPALSAVVTAAVIVRDDSQLEAALDTVARQSYETAHTVVVGGGESVRTVARERSVDWVPDMQGLMKGLPSETTHVWLVHDDAAPRKDVWRLWSRGRSVSTLRSQVPNFFAPSSPGCWNQ